MAEGLKPCPFCGGKPMLDGSFRANAHGIFCTRCDAKIVHQGLDSRRLIDAWNTRVGEEVPFTREEAMVAEAVRNGTGSPEDI